MKAKRWLAILMAAVFALTMVACEDSNDDNKGGDNNGKIKGNVIRLNGGIGTNGPGGDGGMLGIRWVGTAGIQIRKSGDVDTSFNIPTYTDVVDLGAVGWVVEEDYTVLAYSGVPGGPGSSKTKAIADGDYFFNQDDTNLYHRVGQIDEIVTGIRVNSGVTLTFELNEGASSVEPCNTGAEFELIDDLDVRGTVTIENVATTNASGECVIESLDSGSLTIDPNRVYIGEKALITAQGLDAVSESSDDGGDGGGIFIEAMGGFYSEGDFLANGGDGDGIGDGGSGGGIMLYSEGPITNKGDLDASGGYGSNGGFGGAAQLLGFSLIWNSGDLTANGGDGSTGAGGSSMAAVIIAFGGSVHNKGKLSANGGSGPSGGGSAGQVVIESGMMMGMGNLVNSGNLLSNGGDALTSGDGGMAGMFSFMSSGGNIKNTGRLEGEGGDGAGIYSLGGHGAYSMFYAIPGYDINILDKDAGKQPPMFSIVNSGDVIIANDILASGGDGTVGGDGGMVSGTGIVIANEALDDYDTSCKLIGFDSIELNGGDGSFGGFGGYVGGVTFGPVFYAYYYSDYDPPSTLTFKDGYSYLPFDSPGPIINNVPIEANGGEGATGTGGDGGGLEWLTIGDMYGRKSVVENAGRIELMGGYGDFGGGYGGFLLFSGFYHVGNLGNVVADSGDGGDGPGSTTTSAKVKANGIMNEIILDSTFDVDNDGDLSVNGGDGVSMGRDAGMIGMFAGNRIRNSGNLAARGGDGSQVSGDGGEVFLGSDRHKTHNSGNIDVRGGEPNGLIGFIFFDNADVTPLDGTLGF